MQMECYGRSFNRREQCGQCELRDYCRDAGDIPLCMYCTKYPFLSGILKNRPLYNRWQQHERKVSMTEYRGGKFLAALIRLGLYRQPMIQPELELFPDGDPDGDPDGETVNFSNCDSKFFQRGHGN